MTKLFTTSQAQSSWLMKLTVAVVLAGVAQAACVDNTTNTQGLQNLLTEGGAGYTLSLCAGQVYAIDQSLNFTNTSQVSTFSLDQPSVAYRPIYETNRKSVPKAIQLILPEPPSSSLVLNLQRETIPSLSSVTARLVRLHGSHTSRSMGTEGIEGKARSCLVEGTLKWEERTKGKSLRMSRLSILGE